MAHFDVPLLKIGEKLHRYEEIGDGGRGEGRGGVFEVQGKYSLGVINPDYINSFMMASNKAIKAFQKGNICYIKQR